MKGLLKSRLALFLVILVLLVGVIAIPLAISTHHVPQAHAASSTAEGPHGLEGGWKTVITNHINGSSSTFSGLMTFSAGGGLVDTEQVDLPTEATPGIGSWISTGTDSFALKFYKLVSNKEGNLLFTVLFSLTGQLTGEHNAFHSSGTFTGLNPSGKKIFAGTIDFQGTRINA